MEETWTIASGTTANNLEEIQFADGNRAIAVGEKGTIAMSQDGGQTWTEVQTDIWDHIRSLYFVSDLEGWAVGDRGMIVHTSLMADRVGKPKKVGGGTRSGAPTSSVRKKGWVVGDLGTVLHTADGGETWVQQTPGEFHMLKEVFFLNDKGRLVGRLAPALLSTQPTAD